MSAGGGRQVAGLRPNRVHSIALLRPHVGALWNRGGFGRALLRAKVAGVETIRHAFTPMSLDCHRNASAAARCDSSASGNCVRTPAEVPDKHGVSVGALVHQAGQVLTMTVVSAEFDIEDAVSLENEVQQCHAAVLYADEVTLGIGSKPPRPATSTSRRRSGHAAAGISVDADVRAHRAQHGYRCHRWHSVHTADACVPAGDGVGAGSQGDGEDAPVLRARTGRAPLDPASRSPDVAG